jgi:hypothetical protein
MKKIILIALMGIFVTAVVAQTKTETKPAPQKKTEKTEVAAPATQTTPGSAVPAPSTGKKESAKKHETKPSGITKEPKPPVKKEEMKQAPKKEETPVKK